MKDYNRVQKNAGVEKEQDFLQVNSMGDMLLLYIESRDIQKTFIPFASSKNPFDLWFVEEMKKNTGVDFSQPMPGPLPNANFISQVCFLKEKNALAQLT